MAVKYEEVDVLGGGIAYDKPTKGSFALNMLRRYGAWEVREGFGQLAQFDTLMPNPKSTSHSWGHQKPLGSYIMTTDFGHRQIISVLKAKNNTADNQGLNQFINLYVVSIYDITTGERWEEPLYRHTSEAGLNKEDLPTRHGIYETGYHDDYQSWVSGNSESSFFFAEIGDSLYFASQGTPVYSYTPATFRGNRWRWVESRTPKSQGVTSIADLGDPYSESSLVTRMKPSQGDLPEAFNYREDSQVPMPDAMTSFMGSLIIASDRFLFFSDPFQPNVFVDINVLAIPTEKKIVALSSSAQMIYIYTETETWVYTPATTGLMAAGAAGAIRIADSVGCLGQSAITKAGEATIWVSSVGVHVASGSMGFETISKPIAPLFTDFITDPVSSFFTQTTAKAGKVSLSNTQRNSVVRIDPRGVNVDYCVNLEALLISVPTHNYTLCFTEGQWSLWSFDSNTQPESGASQMIQNPHMVSDSEGLYCVGSIDTQTLDDRTLNGGSSAANADTIVNSYYILEYGRGGAIDRSVDDEDYRVAGGYYVDDTYTAGGGYFGGYVIVGEPEIADREYKFQGTATGNTAPNGESGPALPGKTYLVPRYLVPNTTLYANPGSGVLEMTFSVKFDSTKFRPVFKDSSTSTAVDLILPPARLASAAAYTATCKSGATPSRAGNKIEVIWNASSGTWLGSGNWKNRGWNLRPNRKNLVFHIPIMTTNNSEDLSSFGFDSLTLRLVQIGTNQVFGQFLTRIWRGWKLMSRRKEDNVAQPVDWAYMAADVGLQTDARIKARGTAVTLMSRGQGTLATGLTPWAQGLFNTLIAADLKTWMSQAVDFSGRATFGTVQKPMSIKTNVYPVNLKHETNRQRIKLSGSMRTSEFSGGAVYGNSSTDTYDFGTVQIGDEQVDEFVTSESVKGQSIAVMLFGFMRNPAERLKIQAVKLLSRNIGAGRRRKGR